MKLLSPLLQRLYDDWEARRTGPFLRRSEFDPLQMRYMLGKMSLIDVHRDPYRFFYRLHGTEMAQWLGFDLTNKFMDEAPVPDWNQLASKHLVEVATSGLPSVAWHYDEIVGNQVWNLEALVLPMSQNGTDLDMLISAVIHHKRDEVSDFARRHTKIKPFKKRAAAS